MPSRISHGWAFALVCALAQGLFQVISPAASLASDQTNREVVRTYTTFYLQQKEYGSAAELLRDHLETDAEDASGWNMLGLAHLAAGENREAAQSFRTAASKAAPEFVEWKGVYLYNYADALNRLGNEKAARASLRLAARDPRLSNSVKAVLADFTPGAALPELDAPRENVGGQWRSSFDLKSGYDTNALMVADSSLTSDLASGSATPFVTPSLQVGYLRPLAGGALSLDALSLFAYQTKAAARSFNSSYSSFTAGWGSSPDTFSRFTQRVESRTDLSFLNSNGFQFYNWNETLSWTGAYEWDSGNRFELRVPLAYRRFAVEEGDDPVNDRTGFGGGAGIGFSGAVARTAYSIGIDGDRHLAEGANYRSTSFTVPVSLSRSGLPWGLTGVLGAAAGLTDFSHSSEARRDKSLDVQLSFAKRVGRQATAGFEYGFKRNISNLAAAQYNKHSFGMAVSYELF